MGFGLLGYFRVSFLRLPESRHLHLSAATMNNHLPERWTDYNPVGKRIPGTRFIAFKVPLKKIFDGKLAPWQRFSPTDLISEVEKQNEQLGLVVDLTCTKRYYSSQELPRTLEYFKIFTAGQQVPTDDVIHQFKSVVKQFINENSDNDKLVGVHCTHGLNRTGYLVCRYMIDVLGMVPSDAIEKFNKSRGHCIERKNYLDDLLHGKNRNHPCPKLHLGPRLAAPTFSHKPEHTLGPQRGYPETSGRPPGYNFSNRRNTKPPPVSPHPPMLGSRSHIPQMEGDLPHRSGPRHQHRKRDLANRQDGWPVNGAPAQDFAFPIPQQNGRNMTTSNDTQGFASHGRGYKGPYRRHRRRGHQKNSQQPWQ